MPTQPNTSEVSPSGSTGGNGGAVGEGGPAGWAAYIRALGRKDPANGVVTRNWVKRGRQVSVQQEQQEQQQPTSSGEIDVAVLQDGEGAMRKVVRYVALFRILRERMNV
ncbi:hypothetical protein QFC24_004656 [Naganishia onofrii]|uniref:Uncharacterized protein n=1 Tax=Naganishia onofrii TaxID=1851511 RepID=A0ACC2XD75_9TREE|nr:hypothetical protein QFC24_004656 [Naganishia onofrii]